MSETSQHIAPLLGDLICSELYAENTQMDIANQTVSPSYAKTIYLTLYAPWMSHGHLKLCMSKAELLDFLVI